MEINIKASTGTFSYLYLMKGSSASGSVVEDGDAQGTRETRIVEELTAGTYTVEASALSRSTFKLMVNAHEIGTLPTSGRYETKRTRHVLRQSYVYEAVAIQDYRSYSPYGVTLQNTQLYLKTISGCAKALRASVLSGNPAYAPIPQLRGITLTNQCPPSSGNAPDKLYFWNVLNNQRFDHSPHQTNRYTRTTYKVYREEFNSQSPEITFLKEIIFAGDPDEGISSNCTHCGN